MYFFRKLLSLFLLFMAELGFIVYCLLIIQPVRAAGEFTTNFDVTYEVKETGITEVVNKITLTNTSSDMYATTYSIVLDTINPMNPRAYGEFGSPYTLKTISENRQTILKVEFPDQIVGKDKSRVFYISFEEPSFAVRTGEVWEISIPRISSEASFKTYDLKLKIPERLGQEAYISPSPKNKTIQNNFIVYNFNKTDIEKTGIVAGFGAFQVFSFNLHYHLENPLPKNAKTEITLPPDTAYQKVYYESIEPKPSKMSIDDDGNWIAEYELDGRERIEVVANGHVQIFSNYRQFEKPTKEALNQSLISATYWDINNPEIRKLSQSLKTPKAIYDFVTTKLTYDYSRVKANVERLGAVKALENPQSAICMEFTDLFVTLARAAGIPAREVNGFAYTENPDIQPLSLVNDVLHAWPEYYDSQKGIWIPVDPTWGSTTGGVDYFNKLDLRHFSFVVHGKNSTKPYPAGSYKLGINPQKDVFVSFGELPKIRNSKLTISSELEGWVPLISNRLKLTITNPGPVALYSISPDIFFDNVKQKTTVYIKELLPFQSYNTFIEIPFSFLATKTPTTVKISIANEDLTILTNKRQVLIYNLLFIFIPAIIILCIIMFRLKKWKFPKKNS